MATEAKSKAATGNEPAIVVVGIDGSIASEPALLWAGDEADRLNAKLTVVLARVHPKPDRVLASQPVWPFPVVNRRNLEDVEHTRKIVDEFVRSTLPEENATDYDVVIRDGDAAEELLAEAARSDAVLLVVGRRGLGGFKRLLLGSVSDQCATHAPCPVLVVDDYPTDRSGAIVVGVDGSSGSHEAVNWAAHQAEIFNAPLRVVGVWNARRHESEVIGGTYIVTGNQNGEYAGQARRNVENSIESCAAAHPKVAATGDVVRGSTSEVLTEIAAEIPGSILVVGTRGLGGFRRLLIGSVAHQTLHHSRNPVCVVRPTGKLA